MNRLAAAILLLIFLQSAAWAGSIAVYAAASLTNALTAIKTDYERLHPGDAVVPTFAASGALLSKLDKGDACDVFISADSDTMDMAVDRRRVDPGSRTTIAGNALVLAVPAGNPAHVMGLESLSQGGVRRIGVGNPESVPAGRYAKRALQQKAMWFALTSKLVYYPSVRHVLAALETGETDAGFVYATDAAIGGPKVATAVDVPLPVPVTYSAAVATRTTNIQGATAFLAYLTSPEGRAVLERFGFKAP